MGYVFWKEFMPVLAPRLGLSTGAPTVCGCLVAAASVFMDALGWCYNPSYLPIAHEQIFQLATELEQLVGSRFSAQLLVGMCWCICL